MSSGSTPDVRRAVEEPVLVPRPGHAPLNLPAPLDVLDQVGGLFPAGAHERLDRIIGFDQPGLPPSTTISAPGHRLDNAEFFIGEFAPLGNTITTAKLLLLDGPELNRALGDIVGRDIDTYGPGDNLMVDVLDSNPADGLTPPPWLLSIDADHAWRANGVPVSPEPPGSGERRQRHHAGLRLVRAPPLLPGTVRRLGERRQPRRRRLPRSR